jgi:hypothetical protein
VFLSSYGALFQDLTLYQFSNMVKGFALALGVLVAVVVALAWWRRSAAASQIAAQAQAQRVYANYLLQAMQHPDLARPRPEELGKPRVKAQYHWFVGYLLSTAEEILLVDATPTWRETIVRQLAPHRAYLCQPAFRDGPYRNLSSELKGLVDDAIVHVDERRSEPGNVHSLPRRSGA